MEAMAAMMVVTVALSIFLGLLAGAGAQERAEPDIRVDYLGKLSVSGGAIVGEVSEEMEVQKDFSGFSCVRLRVHVAGETDIYERTAGLPSQGDLVCKTGTLLMKDDKGRSVPAVYEVAVWL